MKRYKIAVTEPAEKDLSSIADYISAELKEPATAMKLVLKIKNAILSLTEMPTRSSLINDDRLAHQGYRKILVDHYVIFYTVSKGAMVVTIVRILYARRDWMNIL